MRCEWCGKVIPKKEYFIRSLLIVCKDCANDYDRNENKVKEVR